MNLSSVNLYKQENIDAQSQWRRKPAVYEKRHITADVIHLSKEAEQRSGETYVILNCNVYDLSMLFLSESTLV